jgi:hypothetical protein
MRTKDLINKRFGKLTVISCEGIKPCGNRTSTYLKCKCDCGKEIEITYSHLLHGPANKSCGCGLITGVKKHGMWGTSLYKRWKNIVRRCCSVNDKSYVGYGAKGIRICNEWRDFNNFYKWAMESGYKPELTIERKNVYGNYEPSNCTWATIAEQNRNKTSIVWYKGVPLKTYLISIDRASDYMVIWSRIKKSGLSVDDAVSKPISRKPRKAS